ncbi:MAG TPA: hypothetical protein VNO21_03480 [Polyangiaceae bacterium]|nr:hypothetical protein [Polyangiaceae bacterium]
MIRKQLLFALGFGVLLMAPSFAEATIEPNATTHSMWVTLYGALDNDPPGSADIAFPQIHSQAGGTGTFADPVTFATSKSELAPGTKVYYPFLKKYFIMEDDCAQCDSDWSSSKKWHIDLWAGNSTNSAILDCEDALTQQGNVIVNPPNNEPVDTTPIFNTKTHACFQP